MSCSLSSCSMGMMGGGAEHFTLSPANVPNVQELPLPPNHPTFQPKCTYTAQGELTCNVATPTTPVHPQHFQLKKTKYTI